MNNTELTNEEKELLRQYQTLSTKLPGLFSRLAVEIIPPIVFVALWAYTGSTSYLITLIAILVMYNVQRVVRQYKNIVKLVSISKKTVGEVSDENKS
jgi:hypothetical protein